MDQTPPCKISRRGAWKSDRNIDRIRWHRHGIELESNQPPQYAQQRHAKIRPHRIDGTSESIRIEPASIGIEPDILDRNGPCLV
eukprot:4089975-Pyramimonas_sp.AAC.1